MNNLPPAATPRRKLIEVSLPLEDINAESAREKSIRYGHPSTLHLWWARRPLAAARAVLFAQIVDDPSSHPEQFPTEESQKSERERLHGLIRRLVKWENITDEGILREAWDEILMSTDGQPPTILDPFAGGGTIPLEAQRLGLEAQASDLNPVAVLINKALVEIPPKFSGRPPVFPGAADSQLTWTRATGLAEDVRRYGEWMRDRAEERLGRLYPKVALPGRGASAVISWIWARTAICPNPSCGIQMPLVRSWWLGKKKGKEAYVIPMLTHDPAAPGGRRVEFKIGTDPADAPTASNDGTMDGQSGGHCVACGTPVTPKQIHDQLDKPQGQAPPPVLIAIVAEGARRRVYLEPRPDHADLVRGLHDTAASLRQRETTLTSPSRGTFGSNAQGRRWGFFTFGDYFTDRQLITLTTLSDLLSEVRERITADVRQIRAGHTECRDADDLDAYAAAVITYLAMAISRLVDYSSSLATWMPDPKNEGTRSTFARQAIAMPWDYSEVNPFSNSSGNLTFMIRGIARALDVLPARVEAAAVQADAGQRKYDDLLVATDPPYYNNVDYSDLSDFFYVWLRRSLGSIYPDLFSTMLVPKVEELIANPYRHGSRAGAEAFFQEGFERVFDRARASAQRDFPITVFYAFKQAELQKEGVTSTGWSTFLEGMIREGWMITATWPVRSERAGRMIAVGTNALASSIVLALRPRGIAAAATDRSGFLAALHEELGRALAEIRQGAIAPADLRQTVLGPGMKVFSQYSRVLEDDGSPMSVKTALALINQTFDSIENEQDADLDADTRFCLDWFKSYGWTVRPYGDAESLALPLGLSVEGIARGGVITSGQNKVALIKPQYLDPHWDPATDDRLSLWETTCHLARTYASEGRQAAAALMGRVGSKVDLDEVNRLAIRLYELMESTDAATAVLFNGLGGAWADVSATASSIRPAEVQSGFDFGDDLDDEEDR